MEDSINQNNTESVVTNFLLEKLNKAGIETILDKETYENMLDYVKEVNISLEMLEADLYPVQMMEEKELSDYHTENILQLARSKEFLQEKDNLFGEKSQAASKNARTTYTTQKFYCLCGGEITMKTLFDKGKLKNVAECTKCNRTERRPKDFN